jgi:hypothetical protein
MATLAVRNRSNALAKASGRPRLGGDVRSFGEPSFAVVALPSGLRRISFEIVSEDQA